MNLNNILMLTDSYKTSHYKQYPPDTQKIYSYFESRGGAYQKTLFFGLQYFLKEYLEGVVVTKEKIDEAEEMINAHMGQGVFYREGWEYILNEHGGKLPVVIKAVKEGSLVDTSNVLMSIENTDPKCFWLVNYLETLLVQVWYPMTVSTQSYFMKQRLKQYLEETSDNPENAGLEFKLHDFGFRGVSSVESAGIGGVAHLVNFMGTDTMASLVFAKKYYDCDCAGFSIPATEHSTITSWGKEGELEAYKNFLNKHENNPLIACVSDSYDIYKTCAEYWGGELKEQVLERNGTLVVRPDSGKPQEVVVEVLKILWEQFGGTVNSKGYKILDPHVRVIQGDGVNPDSMLRILQAMKRNSFSVENIAFGSGGALLQKLDRDTQMCAFKCSAIKRSDGWYKVYKSPIGESFKKSKKGKLKLIYDENRGVYQTYEINEVPITIKNHLIEVFKDGDILKTYTLDEIRSTANNQK